MSNGVRVDDAYTANDLAERLTAWLAADVWPGYTGYCDACPEPAVDRSVDRCPFFVVEITRGAYGVNRGNAAQSAATADVDGLSVGGENLARLH